MKKFFCLLLVFVSFSAAANDLENCVLKSGKLALAEKPDLGVIMEVTVEIISNGYVVSLIASNGDRTAFVANSSPNVSKEGRKYSAVCDSSGFSATDLESGDVAQIKMLSDKYVQVTDSASGQSNLFTYVE